MENMPEGGWGGKEGREGGKEARVIIMYVLTSRESERPRAPVILLFFCFCTNLKCLHVFRSRPGTEAPTSQSLHPRIEQSRA